MKYAAEMFGTFVLVFAGLGTAVIAGGQVGNVGVALAFGLALMAMAFTVGPVSGCHLNPAVTVAIAISRRMKISHALGYMAAQIVGATVASGVVLFIANGAPGGYNAADYQDWLRPATEPIRPATTHWQPALPRKYF